MDHEWISVHGVKICHWCGVCYESFSGKKCAGKVKLTTKGGKLVVERR